MPKELTHWIVARAAAAKADPTAASTVVECIRACPDAFLLGAVAYDGPYYLPKDKRMAILGDQLHGKGVDDAYGPIKRAVAAIAVTPGNPSSAVAFVAGALTHLAADTVFHPAVFYFTGFSTHPSGAVSGSYMFKHRAFETALDLHLLQSHGDGVDRKVSDVFARATAAPDARALIAALARFYSGKEGTASEGEAKGIIGKYGKTQGLFSSASLRLLARLLNLGRVGTNDDVTSLFYVGSNPWKKHLTAPRRYRHPISGTEGVFDARGFVDAAAERAVSFFAGLERALSGDATGFPSPGPCLDSGLSIDEDQTMKYCDPVLVPPGERS